MYGDINISYEKDSTNSNKDSSFTLIENILYCSSPKVGIKSKSNIGNKNIICSPPLSSNVDTYTTHFTFNIFQEISTDVASKEELYNNKKNGNIISDFTELILKNAKSDEINMRENEFFDKLEKEKILNINIKESMEKEEAKEDLKNNAGKSIRGKKRNKKKNFFLQF